jgi:hypothetical protein
MKTETNINFSETCSDTHILLKNNISVMTKCMLFNFAFIFTFIVF